MDKSAPPSPYSIAAVSKLTGVSCHTLRIWERRYGCPTPRRSPAGHRRYGPSDVRQLQAVVQWLQQGLGISKAMARLHSGGSCVAEVPEPKQEPATSDSSPTWLSRLFDGDLAGAETLFEAQVADRPPGQVVTDLIAPALVEVGEGWFRGQCQIAQERCASAFLRRKLEILLDEAQRRNPRPSHSALVGTVQGDRHEGGVLIVSVLLELAGWRAIPLGVDLPTREFQNAVDRWRPDLLALSFVLSRNIHKRFQELTKIHGVPIFVGGRGILNYRSVARRYGLIPLVGPVESSVEQMICHCLKGPPSNANDDQPPPRDESA